MSFTRPYRIVSSESVVESRVVVASLIPVSLQIEHGDQCFVVGNGFGDDDGDNNIYTPITLS